MTEENNDVLVLTDEEGQEHQFTVIDFIEVDDQEYAILLPVGEEEEMGEAIILKVCLDENGDEVLYEIEDDEEWEAVAQAWEIIMADEELGE